MVFVLSCAIVFGCTAFFRPNPVAFAETEGVTSWQADENIETISWYNELTYPDATIFKISNANQLAGLARLVNSGVTFEGKIIKLQDTITLGKFAERLTEEDPYILIEGFEWTPIGTKENPFKGTFDAQNNVIKGIYINSNSELVGLFGEVQGTLKNVNIADSYIKGSNLVGSIAGSLKGNADYCISSANVIAEENAQKVGGLFGEVVGTEEVQSVVTNCSTTDSLKLTVNVNAVAGGTSFIGGVVGCARQNVLLENCYNRAPLTATASFVGGVVGWAADKVCISKCYNDGEIIVTNTTLKEEEFIGGVVGSIEGDIIDNVNSSSVLNCYNESKITTNANVVGGVAGKIGTVTVENSYNNGSVSGLSTVGGLIGSAEDKSSIKDSHNSGAIVATYVEGEINENFGGVIGYNYNSEVKYCYNNGPVLYNVAPVAVAEEGEELLVEEELPVVFANNVAGVIGYNKKGTVSVVFNTAIVGDANANYVAGIIAINDESTLITSVNTGNICGRLVVAGSVAYNRNISSVKNCLSNGEISTNALEDQVVVVGGLVAKNSADSLVLDSYFNLEVISNIPAVGENIGLPENVKNTIGYNKSNMSNIKIELSDGSSCVGVIESFNQVAKNDTDSKWLADTDGSSNITFGEEVNMPLTITEVLAIILAGVALAILVIYISVYIKETRIKASIQEFDGYGKEDFEDMENNM